MKIRPFRRGDAGGVIELVRALARDEKLKPPGASASRRLVRDVGRRVRVLVAEEGGKLVAYAIYLFAYSSFLARPTLYLEDIFVLPEHRRVGIGMRFFRTLVAEAHRRGCGRMEWTVLDWNTPAINFYRKIGARELSEWKTFRLVRDDMGRLLQ